MFFLQIYKQKNDLNYLNIVKFIFCNVIGCFIGIYNFVLLSFNMLRVISLLHGKKVS